MSAPAPMTTPARVRLHPVVAAVLVMAALVGVAASARVLFVLVAPDDPNRVPRQLDFLHHAIDAGTATQMQELFPEGEFFTLVLTGLADAQSGRLADAERLLAASGRPDLAERFGTIAALEHGTFYRGWRLLLAAEIARHSPTSDLGDLQAEADAVEAALLADPQGVPESYVGGRWPCDAVVAMAAVVRVHDLADRSTATERWLGLVNAVRDPETGLLPHRLDGQSLAPQGSSQAIIQSFWPDVTVDPGPDWQRFKDTFVTTELGLVGVREHPFGANFGGNIDSGPLILGVSPSASAVTLAAALAHGDLGLAGDLDREAELLGLPVDVAGGRRFAGGMLPVGDAWVAWARTVPQSASTFTSPDKRAWLWPWAVPGLMVATACGALALLALRRSRAA